MSEEATKPPEDARREALREAARVAEAPPSPADVGPTSTPEPSNMTPEQIENAVKRGVGVILQVPFAVWATRKRDRRYSLSEKEVIEGRELATPVVLQVSPALSPFWACMGAFAAWAGVTFMNRLGLKDAKPVEAEVVEGEEAELDDRFETGEAAPAPAEAPDWKGA